MQKLTRMVLLILSVTACSQEPPQVAQAKQLRQSGHAAQALAVLRAAQIDAPNDPQLLMELGYSLIDSAQPQEAIAVFDRLIAVRADDAMAYNGRAVALDMAGDHAAARAAYDRALALSPQSLNIQNNLGMSMILAGEHEEAKALLEPLLAAHPDNAVIRQNLALAYALSGNKKKALALNMETLPPDEAKKNMAFYERYKKRQSRRSTNP